MATVEQIMKASLGKILVQASEAPIPSDEAQTFIFSLNQYMLALNAEGIELGYTEVSDLGDEVTIPAGAIRGLVANMALELAPDFDAEVSNALLKQARNGHEAMMQIGVSVPTSNYPTTLPIGSGNYDDTFSDYHFYESDEDPILAETTGSVGLESGTEGASND